MRRSPRNLPMARNPRGLTHFGDVHFLHEFHQLLQPCDSRAQEFNDPRDRLCYFPRIHRPSAASYLLAVERHATGYIPRIN